MNEDEEYSYTYYVVFSFKGGTGKNTYSFKNPIEYFSDIDELGKSIQEEFGVSGVIIVSWTLLKGIKRK